MTNDATHYHAALHPAPVRYFESVGSTMDAAAAWLASEPNLPDGAVVIAAEQTQGRGRRARAWLTPPHSALAMSLILRAPESPAELMMLGGVAVCEALTDYSATPPRLKWPNDVQLAGRKVCGVLAEGGPAGAVLGIGLNIAVDFTGADWPATSLNDHRPDPLPLAEYPALAATIHARIIAWRAQLADHAATQYGGLAPSPLYGAYTGYLGMLGAAVRVDDGARVWEGIAAEVSPDGALWLALPDGARRAFHAGDVSLRPARDP